MKIQIIIKLKMKKIQKKKLMNFLMKVLKIFLYIK